MYIFDEINELNLAIKGLDAEIEELISVLLDLENNPSKYTTFLEEMGIKGSIDLSKGSDIGTSTKDVTYKRVNRYIEEKRRRDLSQDSTGLLILDLFNKKMQKDRGPKGVVKVSDNSDVGISLRDIIYKKIDGYKEEKLVLLRKRQKLIQEFLNTASLTAQEVIYILKQFGIFYKCDLVNGKNLLMPEGLVLANRTISEEELEEMLMPYLYPENNEPVKDTLVIPMYIKQKLYDFYIKVEKELAVEEKVERKDNLSKLANRVRKVLGMDALSDTISKTERIDYERVNEKPLMGNELQAFVEEETFFGRHFGEVGKRVVTTGTIPNEYISTLASTMVLSDNQGIPVYKEEDHNVTLNGDVLNIFPEEVLGFVDYYVHEKWANQALTIDEALQEYNTKAKHI